MKPSWPTCRRIIRYATARWWRLGRSSAGNRAPSGSRCFVPGGWRKRVSISLASFGQGLTIGGLVAMAEHEPIPPGLYRHWKGGLYMVLCTGRHSETEEEMVVYWSVARRHIRIRPARMWFDDVGDGRRRFEPVRPPMNQEAEFGLPKNRNSC